METFTHPRTELSFVIDEQETTHEHQSLLSLIVLRFLKNRTAVAGLIFLVLVVLAAILTPILIHETAHVHPAIDTHPENALQGASFAHLLGTDDVGRDELARLLYGARVSMVVGFVSMVVSMAIGVTIGAVAGFYSGWVDNILMRFTDIFLAVPLYLILFVMSAFFVAGGSNSVNKIILLIGLFSWANTARIARGEFLSLREREYMTAARAVGVNDIRMIIWHMLPNAIGPLIVNATLLIGGNIILESTLSFFNFGIQPPDASWGNMLNASQDYFTTNPILVLAPGLTLLFTVLSFNLMGDGLRDALDPYLSAA